MAWEDVGAADEQPAGTARSVIVAGVAVALFRTPVGAWRALRDCCPHMGAPLSAGLQKDGAVVCAWHGWRFDQASGACLSFPGGPSVPSHAVRVEGGRVLVATEPGGAGT
jgi:nitrite reductase/ring-hydroxylating ferredoxin subunit